MPVAHVALWVRDLEIMKHFYTVYFNGTASEKYINKKTRFESYFITFEEDNTRLELMKRQDITDYNDHNRLGWAHVAFGLPTTDDVIKLTEQLQRDGYHLLDAPRWTGDGYFESKILDPEGNIIELVKDAL
jgi:catechol-2,3-dioxygenase